MPKEILYGFEKEFEKGWAKFIKDLQRKNLTQNDRVFKVLATLKGGVFVNQLKELMTHIDCTYSLLHIVHEPIGLEMNERRFSEIKTIWVDQVATSDGYRGSVCVQVRADRWVKIAYSIEHPTKNKK